MTARTSLWFASMMATGLLLIAMSTVGVLRPIENVSYKVLAPVEGVLRAIARPIANTVTNYNDIRDLTRENEALRTENERLNAVIARLQEEATQREALERLVEVKQGLSEHTFLGATVIARDPTNLRQMIAIDRGRDDGIKVGMPVITEGSALVGTISKVESDHAWVTLVTDVNSAVSSRTLESRADGVVSGGYDRRLSMEFVTQDAPVKEGDTVVTSGLGGSYPRGLVIGRVTGIAGSRQEVFRKVTVEPLASLARIETVLVMTSFVPVRLAAP
ncbi:MAG TPA: rod shape-determining protein MreC [Dehalococcoidia bacterium]|nr:rod shape-determining protein MreC [Dehalococcoidia bacterium]